MSPYVLVCITPYSLNALGSSPLFFIERQASEARVFERLLEAHVRFDLCFQWFDFFFWFALPKMSVACFRLRKYPNQWHDPMS